MVIDGVACDTYVYLDDNKTAETFKYSVSAKEFAGRFLYVMLFCDGQRFVLSNDTNMDITCYIKINDDNTPLAITCSLNEDGIIVIPFANDLAIKGNTLRGEINVSTHDDNNHGISRFKSPIFRVAIVD